MGTFWRQVWTISGVWLNILGAGMGLGYSSSLMPALKAADAEIKTDLSTASWIASSIGVAAIPGFAFSSYAMHRYGRRKAQIYGIIPSLVGWILIYFATTPTQLLLGRILCGITAGATVTLGAIIIAEYTSPSHRGMFLNLKTSVACLGGMLVHIFAHCCNWRTVALLSVTPHFLALLIVLQWPESPAWLAYKGEFEKCAKAFYWLRGKNEQTEKEFNDMIGLQTERLKNTMKTSLREKVKEVFKKFTQKDFTKPIFIICIGSLLLEAAGRHIFVAFAFEIMGEITGNKTQSFALTLALDIIITATSVFSSYLMKVMKRRLLLFGTGFSAVFVLAVVCIYLFLVSRNVIHNISPWIAVSLFVIFFIFANLGCSPMPLAFLGELLPLEHRGVGSGIGGIAMALALNLSFQVTPFLLLNCKVYGMFAILGGLITVFLVILYFILPETKDKTLPEIEYYFNHGKFQDDVDKNDKEAMIKMFSDTEMTNNKLGHEKFEDDDNKIPEFELNESSVNV